MSSAAILRPRIAAPRPERPAQAAPARRNWLQWFIVFEIVCQLLLLSSFTGPFRSGIRIAAFGMSLLLLLFMPGRGKTHPASKPAILVIAILAISFFHPGTNGIIAGIAQIALYVAILAPLFWVPRLQLDGRALRVVLLTFWAFQALSAFFGILQVYYPGRFQPNVSSIVSMQGSFYLRDLSIRTATGEHVLRPMGLTDVPGAAGTAGFYAMLLGLGFLLTERGAWRRAIFLGGMFVGMTCIYLSQVRSNLVMLGFCLCGFAAMLAWRRATLKLTTLATVVAGIVLVSFVWAVSMGGGSISKKFATLTTSDPTKTYYKNRGRFLEQTIKVLMPKYPLGAGLGRWGMTNSYFGDHSRSIWVEIMWTGWLLDGGLPLVLAYVITILVAIATALKIALSRKIGELWFWGAVILAYDLAALALTFSYPYFISQTGMEFWMMNAALFAAARNPMIRPAFYRAIRPAAPGPKSQNLNDVPMPVSSGGFRPDRRNGPGQFRPGPVPR